MRQRDLQDWLGPFRCGLGNLSDLGFPVAFGRGPARVGVTIFIDSEAFWATTSVGANHFQGPGLFLGHHLAGFDGKARKQIFYPMVAMQWSHLEKYASPLALTTRPNKHTRKTKTCAYLSHRCEPHREDFFNRLQAFLHQEGLGGCDAIGSCHGNGQQVGAAVPVARNDEPHYIDGAVEAYKPYKFVIAMENKWVDGYLTEKVANALLASSVPLYWGSPAVHEVFNTEAFIELPRDLSPGGAEVWPVLQRIKELATNDTAYRKMQEAPALREGALEEIFSWHDDVIKNMKDPSKSLRSRIRAALLDVNREATRK